MRLTYDPEADILYLRLREAAIEESDEVAPNVVLDFDKAGRAVAIEIGAASKQLDADPLGLKLELLSREGAEAAE